MVNHNIFWWNLENLFDVENSPRRSEFLNKKLRSELAGWTQSVLDKKINNLSSIIAKFNNNIGPDILGVCEVENSHVLELLSNNLSTMLGRNYSYIIVDGVDKRGIDTALIFDKDMYIPNPDIFTFRVTKRNATRDLFQVQLNTQSGNTLVLILNHWPSRSGGQLESEPFRIMVAENLSYWVERIYEELGTETSILLMGDFNDNPYNKSISKHLQSTNIRKKVIHARNHFFYNVMYQFLDQNKGTHVWGSEVNILDQFLVSKSILSHSSMRPFNIEKVEIIDFPELVKGAYNKAIRFSRPNKNDFDPDGFSDHLPIGLVLKES